MCKKTKFLTALFLSVILIFSTASAVTVAAEETAIEMGTVVSGSVSDAVPENRYVFELEESGRLGIKLAATGIPNLQLKLFDETGKEIWKESVWWNSTSKQISYIGAVDLTSGGYSFVVAKSGDAGDYEIELTFESANESFAEVNNGSNNTLREASAAETDTLYYGQLAINDTIDNYTFTLEHSGRIKLSFDAEEFNNAYLFIYDEEGKEIWKDSAWWDSTSKQLVYRADIDLTAGTYTFAVSKYSVYGPFSFRLDFENANESFAEVNKGSNNTIKNADSIELNTLYKGHIAINDTTDNYAFTLTDSEGLDIALDAEGLHNLSLYIYDEEGKEIWRDSAWWNSITEQITYRKLVEIPAGNYYIAFAKNSVYGAYEFGLNMKADAPEIPDKLIAKDDATDITVDEANKIVVLSPKMTLADVENQVINENIRITDKNGNSITGSTFVGTAAVIQVSGDGDEVLSSYTVVVYADVNADGKITAADARLALRAGAKLDTLEGVYVMAADFDRNEKITAADARLILRKAANLD